jgi:hypothetical protein
MSQREEVDQRRIQHFLETLGERFRHAGRVYLVGGTTMVWEGLRAQTIDIDIAYEIAAEDSGEFTRTIQLLKHELKVNVEEAAPGDFIPLPAGYHERSKFIGRFGLLDVFHFDLYSMALSKIERGRDEDLSDVLKLLSKNEIDMPQLESSFAEILPRFESHSLKADPVEFKKKFKALQSMWQRSKMSF